MSTDLGSAGGFTGITGTDGPNASAFDSLRASLESEFTATESGLAQTTTQLVSSASGRATTSSKQGSHDSVARTRTISTTRAASNAAIKPGKHDTGLSKGSAVGVAVVCILITMLLGASVWLILRRYRGRKVDTQALAPSAPKDYHFHTQLTEDQYWGSRVELPGSDIKVGPCSGEE